MATVFDVAQYIRNSLGEISTIKLQKLVYYCKAWSLVWDEDPLFSEGFEAWANGPVVPKLYQEHKGKFFCPRHFTGADVSRLTPRQKENIDIVLKSYGDKSPQYLVALSHSEKPWADAHKGHENWELCKAPITDEAIAEYYSSLKV